MMHKYGRKILLVGVCAFFLAGCSSHEDASSASAGEASLSERPSLQETEETLPERADILGTAVSEETQGVDEQTADAKELLGQVTAEELKRVTKDAESINWDGLSDDEFVVLDRAEGDAVLYGLWGNQFGMVLRVGDDLLPIEEEWASPRLHIPELHAQDLDKDGETEYVLKTLVKTGTGVSVEDFYVIERTDGAFTVMEFAYADWMEQLLSHISWKYDEEYCSAEVYVDGEYAGAALFLNNYQQENQVTFQDLVFGDIGKFICHDGQWYLWVHGGICVEEWATPQFEYGIDVLSPISYLGDGTFRLGEIRLTARDSYSGFAKEDTQEAAGEHVVNVVYADVTHDGVEDRVVTSISCYAGESGERTPAEMLNQGEICYVRVYDGNGIASSYDEEKYALTGGYPVGEAIWQRELANAHVGNGQVFLLDQDGLVYLVEASDYIGQGAVSFSYSILSLDGEGRIFTAGGNSYSLDTNEGYLSQFSQAPEEAYNEEEMKDYAECFEKVLSRAMLIAAADVDKEPRIATSGTAYTYEVSELWQKVYILVDNRG